MKILTPWPGLLRAVVYYMLYILPQPARHGHHETEKLIRDELMSSPMKLSLKHRQYVYICISMILKLYIPLSFSHFPFNFLPFSFIFPFHASFYLFLHTSFNFPLNVSFIFPFNVSFYLSFTLSFNFPFYLSL